MMYKFFLSGSVSLCCALLVAAPAQADIFTNASGLGISPILDFEGSTLGIAQGDEWQTATGISFDAVFFYVADLGDIFEVEGANDFYLAGEAGAEVVGVSFDEPQTSFAMGWGTNPGTSSVTAFLDGSVVDQAVLNTTVIDPASAFLVVEGLAFDRIEIAIEPDVAVTNSFAIDNLQIGSGVAELGSNYCSSEPNSVSMLGASISATGNASLSTGSLTLRADNVPQGLGTFYFGPEKANVRFGNGMRCVGGTTVRMPVLATESGALTYSVDLDSYSSEFATMGAVHFQAWFRDPVAGGAAFNLSDGLEIQFLP